MKTILIATKTNHVKLNYNDFKNADFIIVTQQFLMNFKYYPSLEYQRVTASSICLNKGTAYEGQIRRLEKDSIRQSRRRI